MLSRKNVGLTKGGRLFIFLGAPRETVNIVDKRLNSTLHSTYCI